jgi:hypothetical protein
MDCFGDCPPKSSEIHFCSIIRFLHGVDGLVQVITPGHYSGSYPFRTKDEVA